MDNKLSELKDVVDYWRKVKSGELPAPGPNEISITVCTLDGAVSRIAALLAELEAAERQSHGRYVRIAELESKLVNAAHCITGLERHVKDIEATLIAATDEVADLAKERDEARAKLATPVRLPVPYSENPWMSPDPDGTWFDKGDVKESIRSAGFTVEGDEQ